MWKNTENYLYIYIFLKKIMIKHQGMGHKNTFPYNEKCMKM